MIEKAKVIDALKKGLIDDDDSTVECPYECNGMLEWAIEEVEKMPSDLIRCKDCKWYERWDKSSSYGYCHAMKHCHYSKHWEISIFRTYNEDFFCADAERREDE